jgi:hypothetical protein
MQERVYFVYVLIWLFVHFILALKELKNIELAFVIYIILLSSFIVYEYDLFVYHLLNLGNTFYLSAIFSFYYYFFFFLRTRVCWPLLCLCRPFCIFERCLNSNPESCRSKHRRATNLATHLPLFTDLIFVPSILRLMKKKVDLPDLEDKMLNFKSIPDI